MNGLVSRLIYPGASRSVDVGQVERTLQPGEELVWQETTLDERIGLIIRPPADKQRWIVFFYGNDMTVAGTAPVRRWLGTIGYGVACVEYAGYGVSSGSPSEYGCYRSADAAITYLQQQASIPLDQVTLICSPAVCLAGAGSSRMRAGVPRSWPGVALTWEFTGAPPGTRIPNPRIKRQARSVSKPSEIVRCFG